MEPEYSAKNIWASEEEVREEFHSRTFPVCPWCNRTMEHGNDLGMCPHCYRFPTRVREARDW